MAILESVFGDPNESPNALMRFGAHLQGSQAVQQMNQQYAMRKLAPRIQQGDKSALMELAMVDPQAASALSQMVGKQGTDYTVKDIGGKLVRYAEDDPNFQPQVIYGDTSVNPEVVKGEGDLRKEFDSLQKDYRSVRDGYKRLEAAAAKPSAAGDLALIFNYMKILDPGSTVREGEFANAQNAAGVPAQVLNMYNRALTGERLNPDQRQDFVGKARELYDAQTTTYNETAQQYRELAKQYGYDPERIAKEVKQQKPQVTTGAIKDGTVARNPKTGERIVFKNGRWEPL